MSMSSRRRPCFGCLFLLSQGWFLTDFASALAIVGAYLLLATVGPLVMSMLPPIDSYPVRFVYNVVQVSILYVL